MAITIADEITRIKTNISNAYKACQNKGATLPETQNSANLATTIDSISSGSSPILIEKDITENDRYDARNDGADGYSIVNVSVAGRTEVGNPFWYNKGDDSLTFSAGYLKALFGYSKGEFTEEINIQNSGGSIGRTYNYNNERGRITEISFMVGRSSPVYICLDLADNYICSKENLDEPNRYLNIATISFSGDWGTGLKVDGLSVLFPEEWRYEQLF